MPITAAIISAATGVGETIYGAVQEHKANKLAESNARPPYQVNPAYQDILRMAQSNASQGIPSSALRNYYGNATRSYSNAVDSTLKTGGSPNDIANLYNKEQQNFGNILAQDANAKLKNILGAENAEKQLADQENQAWLINVYQPYADKAALTAQEKTAGVSNIEKGIGGIASTAISALAAKGVGGAGSGNAATIAANNEFYNQASTDSVSQNLLNSSYYSTPSLNSIPGILY